ncbi:hypothetical protein AB6O49_30670 [Streptomyces sp. SBR177]
MVELPPAPEPYVKYGEGLEQVARDLARTPLRQAVWITAQKTVAPGAGRTAMALALAHRAAPDFPDGVFFVPLRASGRRPVEPLAALLGLLADLGGETEQESVASVPDGVDAVLARLQGRRVLLVLDDVGAEEFVGLLADGLPEGCAVVATSRQWMPPAKPSDSGPG